MDPGPPHLHRENMLYSPNPPTNPPGLRTLSVPRRCSCSTSVACETLQSRCTTPLMTTSRVAWALRAGTVSSSTQSGIRTSGLFLRTASSTSVNCSKPESSPLIRSSLCPPRSRYSMTGRPFPTNIHQAALVSIPSSPTAPRRCRSSRSCATARSRDSASPDASRYLLTSWRASGRTRSGVLPEDFPDHVSFGRFL